MPREFPDPGLDYREHPEAYRVARGEVGVLTVEPYKSELLPLWKFRTEDDAKRSASLILAAYRRYKRQGDFVGMDMARKYLQMGYTRARRYARHANGRKYGPTGRELPERPDPEKQRAAIVFLDAWRRVRQDRAYLGMKRAHLARTKPLATRRNR